MTQHLTIIHLYAAEMNIYGDRGNIITLIKRLEWRGLEAKVQEVGIGEAYEFEQADIIFAGGGQDRGQVAVGQDLQTKAESLHQAAQAGVTMLTVCGTYQLFGRRFVTLAGEEIPGIGIFGAETVGGSKRMIGNITIETEFGRLVGFENHSGRTRLDSGQAALGRVMRGHGNDGTSKAEGAVMENVYGTYLHGPVLPQNPHFADRLILTALQRKYGTIKLTPLDDTLELAAAAVAGRRPQ